MRVCTLGMRLEPLFVLDNRLIRAACAQKSAREIVSRFFLVGYGREARPVPDDGTVEITFGYEYVRKVAGGFGVFGADVEGLLIMDNRIISTSDGVKRNTEIVLCF